MDYILTDLNWWKGYCNPTTARTIRYRHDNRTLTEEVYDKVTAYHGFVKKITYHRPEIKNP